MLCDMWQEKTVKHLRCKLFSYDSLEYNTSAQLFRKEIQSEFVVKLRIDIAIAVQPEFLAIR